MRSQRLAILEYARAHDFLIDDFIEATASGQASEKRRRLDELTSVLQRGDRLVVSELSRLGRSLGQIVTILDALAKAGVAFVALKENIRVDGERDIQTKVMTTLFALFAEVERDLISERTREGLARARSSGRKLGRPKGSLGVSRLDGKEDEIRHFLELGVSKTAIAKIRRLVGLWGGLERVLAAVSARFAVHSLATALSGLPALHLDTEDFCHGLLTAPRVTGPADHSRRGVATTSSPSPTPDIVVGVTTTTRRSPVTSISSADQDARGRAAVAPFNLGTNSLPRSARFTGRVSVSVASTENPSNGCRVTNRITRLTPTG